MQTEPQQILAARHLRLGGPTRAKDPAREGPSPEFAAVARQPRGGPSPSPARSPCGE
jgi:hypothetical protein